MRLRCLQYKLVLAPHHMGSNVRVPFTPGQAFYVAACTLLLLALCLIVLCCAAGPVCTLMCTHMHASIGSFNLVREV